MSISKSMLRSTVTAVLVLTLAVPVLAAPAVGDDASAPAGAWSRVADQLSAWGNGLVQAFSGLLGDPADAPVGETSGDTTSGDGEDDPSGGGDIHGGADPNG